MTDRKSDEERMIAAAKKAERAREGVLAMHEYENEKARIDANMERLRALRLAKQAADAIAAQAAAVAAPRKSAKARPAAPARASRARKSSPSN